LDLICWNQGGVQTTLATMQETIFIYPCTVLETLAADHHHNQILCSDADTKQD
jgi:hypothetical protein